MSKDQENLCGKPARLLVGWANYPLIPMCNDHHAWAKHIMETIGARLIVQRAEPGATCTQSENTPKG